MNGSTTDQTQAVKTTESPPIRNAKRSPEFKEGFVAVAIVFLVTLIANQKWSAAIIASLSTLIVVAPFYPLLRAIILKRMPVRIASVCIGMFIVGSYIEKYDNSKKYEFTYRVGSVGYDGRRSDATGSGAQSGHGGVKNWLRDTTVLERTEKERRKHAFGIVAYGISMGSLLLVAGLMPNVFALKPL